MTRRAGRSLDILAIANLVADEHSAAYLAERGDKFHEEGPPEAYADRQCLHRPEQRQHDASPVAGERGLAGVCVVLLLSGKVLPTNPGSRAGGRLQDADFAPGSLAYAMRGGSDQASGCGNRFTSKGASGCHQVQLVNHLVELGWT